MQLSIQQDEAELLHRILTQYLSELKSEISNTENFEWRQGMKRDEDAVKRMISQLEQSKSGASGSQPDATLASNGNVE